MDKNCKIPCIPKIAKGGIFTGKMFATGSFICPVPGELLLPVDDEKVKNVIIEVMNSKIYDRR